MNLASIFSAVAYKRLVQVDLPNKGSHQHELNGVRALGKVFGYEKLNGSIFWIRFPASGDVERETGEFTWYDARAKSAVRTGRSEWRLYYSGSFLARASVGDVLVVAKRTTGEFVAMILEEESPWFSAASKLLGSLEGTQSVVQVIEQPSLERHEIPDDDPFLKVLEIQSGNGGPAPAEETIAPEPGSFSGEFKFRPASRLIATIGQDLIKDAPAAIIELVKNSYDADSTEVTITIQKGISEKGEAFVSFRIQDDGHGMTHNTVVNNWLVPATPYKASRKYSPNGRRMQGNKGIGRYASFVLGNELLLKTVAEKEETTVLLDWRDFEKYEFLDQVPVIVENRISGSKAGTTFEIIGKGHHAAEWDEIAVGSLRTELKKLISPFNDETDPFKIALEISGFSSPYEHFREHVEPLSLVEFFDYRMSGIINIGGVGTLVFENQVGGGEDPRDVEVKVVIPPNQFCGNVEIDLRVYDRDPDAIEELISRGLRDPESGNELGKREARALLDSSSGVSIFRGQFKIRPYGDPGFDWLELDKQRVQNPTLRIGSNQIIGFVRIQPEEISHLEEKSARDGLKEDSHYQTLKRVVAAALAELEQRRFVFRRKAGRGRRTVKVDQVVDQLVNFESAISKIEDLLTTSNVPVQRIKSVRDILEETKREKQELIGQIRETIAIYQGQATLGKIIMVLLHEGRKPIGYFRDMTPILREWIGRLKLAPDQNLLDRLIARLENVETQSDILTKLFDRLEPLSVRKRHKPRSFSVVHPINKSIEVFQAELNGSGIITEVDPNLTVEFLGWEEDFLLIFANLIENSIYWLRDDHTAAPKITMDLIRTRFGSVVQYKDNGPGIPEELLKDQSVFEPGFSTKKGGTGLGLAIAGEAAERNGCKLKAYQNHDGAKFMLELFPGINPKEK